VVLVAYVKACIEWIVFREDLGAFIAFPECALCTGAIFDMPQVAGYSRASTVEGDSDNEALLSFACGDDGGKRLEFTPVLAFALGLRGKVIENRGIFCYILHR